MVKAIVSSSLSIETSHCHFSLGGLRSQILLRGSCEGGFSSQWFMKRGDKKDKSWMRNQSNENLWGSRSQGPGAQRSLL